MGRYSARGAPDWILLDTVGFHIVGFPIYASGADPVWSQWEGYWEPWRSTRDSIRLNWAGPGAGGSDIRVRVTREGLEGEGSIYPDMPSPSRVPDPRWPVRTRRIACPGQRDSEAEPLPGSVALQLVEALDEWPPGPPRERAPSLYLHATAKQPSPCVRHILMRARPAASTIDVDIAGLTPGLRCNRLASDALPTGSVRLPVGFGTYALTVRRADGTTDRYQLVVTDSSTAVTSIAASFTTLGPAHRWRARRFTLQMTCALPGVPLRDGGYSVDSSGAWVCRNFAQFLQDSLGMQPFRFPPGGAVPFPPTPARTNVWGEPLYFKYGAADDFHRAYELLQRSGQTEREAWGRPRAMIWLRNWRGVIVRSSSCRPEQYGCWPRGDWD